MKEIILILAIFFIGFASAEMSFVLENSSLDILKDEQFDVIFTAECLKNNCTDFIAIKIQQRETVEYLHPNNSSDMDCFGGTCLYMDNHGPVYNYSGNSNWGAGNCSNVTGWVGADMTQLAKSLKYVEGMKKIIGVELCLETDNGELWDIVFKNWSGSGKSNFEYERSTNIETFSSNGFELTQGKYRKNITLYKNQSKTIRFPIVTSEVGEYNLTFYSTSDEFLVKINVSKKI